MRNDLTNEISNARSERLHNLTDAEITTGVYHCVEQLSQGAANALQGIDAKYDGITKAMFEQALSSAEMDGSLVFPGYDDVIPPDAEPVSYELAQNVVFGRVARAILVVNGYAKGFDVK